jgi:hypothetical protein
MLGLISPSSHLNVVMLMQHNTFLLFFIQSFPTSAEGHGLFLEGVYKIELDTKTEYGGF